ncbi:HAD-like domain-containing protein [Schizophyllum commune]
MALDARTTALATESALPTRQGTPTTPAPSTIPTTIPLATLADPKVIIDSYDAFLFDCDGVLWHGDRLVPGAKDVLAALRAHGKTVMFITNNATKSRAEYKTKFDKLGIAAEPTDIHTSASATARYVASVLKLSEQPKSKAYIVGMEGLETELRDAGVETIGGSDPAHNPSTTTPPDLTDVRADFDDKVGAVICGLDTRVNYLKLARAFVYLQDPNVHFVATNLDATYPHSAGLLPGAGSVSAMLRYSTKREPLSIGKPSSAMWDAVRVSSKLPQGRTLMVGDRLDTDIAFGKSGGVGTLLVLSGIATTADITPANAPDYVLNSVADLLSALQG